MLLAEDLDEHDGEEGYPYRYCLPRPKPHHHSCQIGQCAGEHGVAIETVGAVGHQVLGARRHFVAESIHRVAFPAMLHVDDGPDAQRYSSNHQ